MPGSAALSIDFIERDPAANEHTRIVEQRYDWSPQVDVGYQATGVTFCEERKEWLVGAYKRLSRFAFLEDDWDSYGAQAPSRASLDTARNILHFLDKADFEPSSVDPSAEGGVCLSFQCGDRYGDIECFNSGEILAVTSSGCDDTNVWEVTGLDQHLETALGKIRTFVER